MLFFKDNSLVNLDSQSIHNIDTKNVLHLHELWSVLHKCSHAMEDGARLENLSWRLFSRESFCCTSQGLTTSLRSTSAPTDLPALSSSTESTDSDDGLFMASRRRAPPEIPPEESHSRKQPHISSLNLEKIVASIKQNHHLLPLPSLPSSLTPAHQVTCTSHETEKLEHPATIPETELATHAPIVSSPTPTTNIRIMPATSSIVTLNNSRSDISDMSPHLASSETESTDMSATSIVRGFSKGQISSYQSRTNLTLAPTPTPPASIAKHPSSLVRGAMAGSAASNKSMFPSGAEGAMSSKKKPFRFQLGGASTDDGEGSSLDSFSAPSQKQPNTKSSLGDPMRSRGSKITSFKEEVATRRFEHAPYPEDPFEDSEEEDEDCRSGSAIEDDDVEEDWEDDDDEASSSSANLEPTFNRVDDSKPNLTSRKSLLTNLMHEKDRALALQNAASRSSPAIRRSRTTSPNGPLGSSPQNIPQALPSNLAPGMTSASQARSIIMNTANLHPPALSPRTTRRNMLSTELTESLRKHLLWDRQVNRSTTNAALKRRHTAQDMTKLKNFPDESRPAPSIQPAKEPQNTTNSWNNYFDSGLQEYHQKGW
ncbi:hypothetical protein E2P81_ATG05290 [Venturia nashicola]|uniref:Uncharacterized protein n=1 Tax=Venturia nashicola TaxID=86259 RepID=A0A4Z1P2Y2_9PEZI|nr:hypothetical protein E6O75_ATG05423 [Venturia nashicola]TLD32314.1 hypothetical protein E2P81_ATG05290 [Venturia nashicola]